LPAATFLTALEYAYISVCGKCSPNAVEDRRRGMEKKVVN
jgi:hypothetical protein